MDYVCSLDMKGLVPRFVTNFLGLPQQMHGAHRICPVRSAPSGLTLFARARLLIPVCVAVPLSLQLYFQQIRPLADCDANDGKVVGQLLVDLVERRPTDPPHAVREFAYRTAMLRECGLRNIGSMLARLLNADAYGPEDDVAIEGLDPSSVTEKQAASIASAVMLSVYQSHMPAMALQKVINSQAVTKTMKSRYAWFVPMLEILLNRRAVELHRFSLVKRLSRMRGADVELADLNVVPLGGATPNSDEAGAERGFNSVVQPSAHSTVLSPNVSLCHVPLQVPVNACVSEVVGTTLDETAKAASAPSGTLGWAERHDASCRDTLAKSAPSHVNPETEERADFAVAVRCATGKRAAADMPPYCGNMRVPTGPSSPDQLPPQATSSACLRPVIAWHDTTESHPENE
jgi:hypothetical protein